MDNFLNLLPNEIDLINITSKITTVLNTYGFQLTKFVSNLPAILKSLPSSKYALERTLGLIWNINTDKLSFKPVTKVFLKTKRGILSMISTIMIH